MLSKSFSFLAILVLLTGASSVSAQLKKVRFSTTGISISELPFKVAQVKGFWREEGLDIEAILMRDAVGMQALLGGSVDYTSASQLDHRGGRARSAGPRSADSSKLISRRCIDSRPMRTSR